MQSRDLELLVTQMAGLERAVRILARVLRSDPRTAAALQHEVGAYRTRLAAAGLKEQGRAEIGRAIDLVSKQD